MQQHVVHVHALQGAYGIPVVMEALADKSAPTLCTSLEGVLRSTVEQTCMQPQAHPMPLLFWHILVGDGIQTNEAAAKLLWACVQTQPLAANIRYLLGMIRCVAHQVSLTAKAAVTGVAARVGDASHASVVLYDSVCATTTRLYKYLFSDDQGVGR